MTLLLLHYLAHLFYLIHHHPIPHPIHRPPHRPIYHPLPPVTDTGCPDGSNGLGPCLP